MSDVDIYSPNPSFTGSIGSVAFVDGHAVADDESDSSEMRYFRTSGFSIGPAPEGVTVEAEEPKHVEPEVAVPGMPGSSASRGELAAFAEGMGIETEGLTKAQILAKIKAQAAS